MADSQSVHRFHKWALWLWVCPGLPISIYLRNSVAWVMFCSVYTILMQHALGQRQESEE